MGYHDAVLRAMPFSTFKLNSAETAYVDVSGRNSTFNGTAAFGPSVLAGATKSLSINGGTSKNVTTSVFKAGSEANSFTLIAWFAPTVFTVGSFSILSHNNIYDGLMFDGDFIKFRIKSSSGNFLEASWPVPDRAEAYMVAGVYNSQKIQLFINGEVVAENDVTDEFTTFATEPSSNLYIGQATSTTYRAVLDGISIFGYALTPVQIMDMFIEGRDVIATVDAVGTLGGSFWDATERSIALQREWTGDEWDNAILTDTSATDGTLRPQNDFATGLSIAGTWRGVLELLATEVTSLGGVRLEWDGDGSFTVATSVDGGSTWTTATNGKNVAGTYGIDSTVVPFVDIRITFAGGSSSDISTVRSLRATAYADSIVSSLSSARTITVNNNVSTSTDFSEPIERNINSGFNIYGGNLTVSSDPSATPDNVSTIEVWVRQRGVTSGTGGHIIDTRDSGGTAFMWTPTATNLLTWSGFSAVYVNNVLTTSGTYTMKYNEPVHIVAVFSTPFNTEFTMGSNSFDGVMSVISVYPTALTATQVNTLYTSYGKVPSIRIDDSAVITVFDPADPLNAYAYNWESQNA